MSPARKRNLVIYIVGGVLMITLPLFAVWMGSIVSGSEGTVISDELQFFRNALLVASAVAAVLLLVLYWHFQQLLSEYLQEKRKVEEKLETYSARLTSYIESPEYVSIFSLDRDMCYTGFNSLHQKEMRLYFHAHAEEGAYIVDLLPDEIRERTVRNFKRALNGEHFSVTSLYNHRYYTQIFNPVYDDHDNVVGLTSNVFDVTDRIQAEQELENYKDQLEELVRQRTAQLEEQSEFFQKIIDNLPNLIFVRDAQSKYVLVNQAMADSFGLKIEEFIGRTISETHQNAEDAEKFAAEDVEILANNKTVEEESLHKYPDGSEKWLFLSKRRMQIGAEKYLLGVHNDITNLKQTEFKLLEANHELQQTINRLRATQMRLIESEKMASLGQLTAGLAHEINNPINYVAGNIGPIRRDLGELKEFLISLNNNHHEQSPVVETQNFELLFDELDSLLEGVNEGADRVKTLMNDLNTFSLPEGAKKVYCDVNDSLKSTINLVRHHLKDRIRLELDFGELPDILCNPQQLSQVFLNILNNAIQAIAHEGVITVKTKRKDGHVVIELSDTGHGISKEHINKIFDPFFTTKEVGEGTGLGLSISYRIIEEHKGKIEVYSAPGKGARFRIFLPLGSDS